MNKIERIIYDIVKSNPKVKLFIRNIYQSFFDALPRRKEISINTIYIKEGYFLGFHDQQPFSLDSKLVLANKLYMDIEMPTEKDFIDIGYLQFNVDGFGDYVRIGRTNAWNYHKGCRLQWLTDRKIIFNNTNERTIVSNIIDIDTKEEEIIPFPIDSASSDGIHATSFSYERLEKFMPGYGYCHQDDISFLDQRAPEGTGFYLVNLKTKEMKMLVSLKELASQSANDEISSTSSHYVTHSLFSHDGRYISFFHRWVGEDTRKRYTRLMIYDMVTEKLFQVPTGYMVSHYVWNSRHEIVVYCNFDGVDSHVLLNIEDLSKSHKVGYPLLNSDGHQSFVNDNVFVTDTYPDKWRMAKLFLVDIPSDNVIHLASVYSPSKFQTKIPTKHIACDLHPRVSPDGKYVCFDTVKSGERALAVMSLDTSVE